MRRHPQIVQHISTLKKTNMDIDREKLSPTELLAQLKAESSAADLNNKSHPASALAVAEPPESRSDRAANGESKQSDKKGGAPDPVAGNSRLTDLFKRVNTLLGENPIEPGEVFRPAIPDTLEETRLTFEEVERLILKFLLAKGSAHGRQVCLQISLPFGIVEPILKQLKREQLIALKGAAAMGDYEFAITDSGRERARNYAKECTYFGAAPVSLHDYVKSVHAQSITDQLATEEDLLNAFSDLIINKKMMNRLGPAINSGRGMFLFGPPGNGKTSIAERVTKCFGSAIWIPKALGFDGDIVRLYDPSVHEIVEHDDNKDGLFDLSGVDPRWVCVVRPTVIAGGELTMNELEITQNRQTKICESPLQMKSNSGTLVIDDFGRQKMPVDELLNRWIVPLEKRYDFLNLPSGKKVQVPFDQLIIFSTNLEPKDLVDGAFLRRIPYKIEIPDPSEDEFRELFKVMASIAGFEYRSDSVDYLIETHYRAVNRPFRSCQPRDLLLQIKNYCSYRCLTPEMSNEGFDFAVENYFSMM